MRDPAFKTIRGFLGKLEKVSEDPSLRETMGNTTVPYKNMQIFFFFGLAKSNKNISRVLQRRMYTQQRHRWVMRRPHGLDGR